MQPHFCVVCRILQPLFQSIHLLNPILSNSNLRESLTELGTYHHHSSMIWEYRSCAWLSVSYSNMTGSLCRAGFTHKLTTYLPPPSDCASLAYGDSGSELFWPCVLRGIALELRAAVFFSPRRQSMVYQGLLCV